MTDKPVLPSHPHGQGPGPRDPNLPPLCTKCDGDRTRIVGQSGVPPVIYYRCDDCTQIFGRSSVKPPSPPHLAT